MYNYVIDSLIAGINPVYLTQITVYFLNVPNRNTNTLAPVIGSMIQTGSIVTSDEWKAYNFLNSNGYIHFTVNHSTDFVDPITKAHTQRIESMWAAAKL